MRVVFDTGPLRNFAEGEFAKSDLTRLPSPSAGVAYSLSTTAMHELIFALDEERLTWKKWRKLQAELRRLIDRLEPIVGSARTRKQTRVGDDRDRRFRGLIFVLLSADTREMLLAPYDTTDALGQPNRLQINPPALRREYDESCAIYQELILKPQTVIHAYESHSGKRISTDVLTSILAKASASHGDVEELDMRAHAALVADRTRSATDGFYDPEGVKNKNDAWDSLLLFVLGIAETVLISSDTKFLRHVHRTHPAVATRVFDMAELYARLSV